VKYNYLLIEKDIQKNRQYQTLGEHFDLVDVDINWNSHRVTTTGHPVMLSERLMRFLLRGESRSLPVRQTGMICAELFL